MKNISNPKIKVSADGKTATITVDIKEIDFDRNFVQRVTVGHVHPDNMAWPRHAQISHDAFFLTAFGNGMNITIEDFAKIAAAIEPKSTYPPKFNNSNDPLTVEIASELSPDFQWEVADKETIEIEKNRHREQLAEWKPISGATSKTLDKSLVKSGQFVRCIASSEAGKMASNPVQIK